MPFRRSKPTAPSRCRPVHPGTPHSRCGPQASACQRAARPTQCQVGQTLTGSLCCFGRANKGVKTPPTLLRPTKQGD
eukprot:1497354-Rhodomonas_salina.2